ncbi:MAG: shikimate dehydrogenase, partial [Sediminibacterium sp.]|nr:shikimate dehydrogenase [Sediminibacterium sp.]
MRRFGLIGFPLTHSFSKKFFSEKFEKENIPDCAYENYPIENIHQLQDLISNT